MSAQRINRMWTSKDYEGLYAERDRVDRMSGGDMLRVAQASFILEHDSVALSIVELAIKKNYADDRHYFVKGEVLRSQRLFIPAAEAFHQALAIRPRRLTYMMAKADAYYRGNNSDSALAVFTRVHDLFPERDVATYMECQIPAEQGYLRKAFECWKVAVTEMVAEEYKVRGREQLMTLAWHGLGDTAEAIHQIEVLKRIQPTVIKHRLAEIQINAEQGNWDIVDEQKAYIRERFDNGTLPAFYADKNAYPLMDLLARNYRLQFFETLQIRESSTVFKAKWTCFLATPQQGVVAGRYDYIEDDAGIRIESEEEGFVTMTFEEPLSLQEFYIYMKSIESNL